MNIENIVEKCEIDFLSNIDKKVIIDKLKQKIDQTCEKYIVVLYSIIKFISTDFFILNIDNIWELLGYESFNKCKSIIISKFKEDKDFVFFDNKSISININCFKKLCLIEINPRSLEFYNSYVSLLEIINELLIEKKIVKKEVVEVEDLSNNIYKYGKDKKLMKIFNSLYKASIDAGCKSDTLKNHIDKDFFKDHYWSYNDTFIENNFSNKKKVANSSKSVYKFNEKKELDSEYTSIVDALKTLDVGRQKFVSIIDKPILLEGYYWKFDKNIS